MAKKTNGNEIETGSNGHGAVSVRQEKGQLIITCDLTKPTPSASGKTLVVASTHGNVQTSVMIQGRPVTIGLNAYIKAR